MINGCCKGPLFLLLLLLLISDSTANNETRAKPKPHGVVAASHNDGFCEAVENRNERDCPIHDNELLWFFLSLFLIITWGAFVRTMLKITKISLPYSVILMITGLVIGCGTHIPSKEVCSFWSKYTKLARMAPKVILYVFLPVLIFESAYNMNVHVFMRSLSQILVLALPGMIISVFSTGLICYGFMTSYAWDYPIAFMYGSIISATDPVAVVAILKELGTSETLSMLIEGESLLNDGVAILMFEIFKKIIEKEPGIILEVVITLIKIGIGGPVFGYVFGKICSMSLAKIFNDAATEITITLFSSYIVYWVGEELGISGVISVVVLGLKLSADSTSISPEVEKMVHHFWEMVAYLANTVLFVLVGIILSETAISQINTQDWFNLFFLYVILNLVRLIMLLTLMPWLSRIGYGLKWKDMVVSMWGGLRGAVGLCLSLEVYYNSEFCERPGDSVGPKFLFHTAGIVFLTLALNGTTTKALLDALHLTDVSAGRLQDMNNAVKQVIDTKTRAVLQYHHDRFLADADWDVVQKYTRILDPYKEQKVKLRSMKVSKSVATLNFENPSSSDNSLKPLQLNTRASAIYEEITSHSGGVTGDEGFPVGKEIPRRVNIVSIAAMNELDPSPGEFRQQAEESRQRLLKALKVSFWRQYDQGVLSDLAVQILIGVADRAGDNELHMIHASDFQKYFVLHGFFYWFRKNFIQRFHLDSPPRQPPKPLDKWRHPFWTISIKEWFSAGITLIVLLNMIPAIWEFVFEIKYGSAKGDLTYTLGFLIANCVFTGIYFLEFLIKMIGHGVSGYFKDRWNWIDLLILIVGFIDISFTIAYMSALVGARTNSASSGVAIITRTFRLVKIIRSLRLLKCFVPRCNKFLDTKVNYSIFLGYDIGKGFVTAVDDVIKFLPQMVEHKKVLRRLEQALRTERLETIRFLGLLQQKHPYVAIAVKTRHASRAVLNQMRHTLNELKEDGLLDQSESGALLNIIETKMKDLWSTPPTIVANPSEATLSNILWLYGAHELTAYIRNNATLLNFSEGDEICAVGDPPNGIYVIVKGMVKVNFVPTIPILEAQVYKGQLPNVEVLGNLGFHWVDTDYLQVGYAIGEIGILTGLPCSSQLTCETSVSVYHISHHAMLNAIRTYDDEDDSLESRIWRSVGMRIAASLLPLEPEYQAWTLDRIRVHVEQSAVPIGPKFESMTIPEFICDVILLQGQIQDGITKEIYTAPRVLPRTCKKFTKVVNALLPARFLVIAEEEMDEMEEKESEDEDSDQESSTSVRKSGHSSITKGSSKSSSVLNMLQEPPLTLRRRKPPHTLQTFNTHGKERGSE